MSMTYRDRDRLASVRRGGEAVPASVGSRRAGAPRAVVVAHVGLDVAVAHADDAPGPGGDVVFVRDHDDRLAGLVELGQQLHDLVAGLRVEVAGRLVGQDDVRVVDQDAGDGHALLLAAGELHRPVVEPVAQADQLGQVDAALARLAR